MFADIEQAIQELYGATASAILEGLLSVSTGKLASVINGLGSSARVLVGTDNNNKSSDSNHSHHHHKPYSKHSVCFAAIVEPGMLVS